jgi:hypothetical protein
MSEISEAAPMKGAASLMRTQRRGKAPARQTLLIRGAQQLKLTMDARRRVVPGTWLWRKARPGGGNRGRVIYQRVHNPKTTIQNLNINTGEFSCLKK